MMEGPEMWATEGCQMRIFLVGHSMIAKVLLHPSFKGPNVIRGRKYIDWQTILFIIKTKE